MPILSLVWIWPDTGFAEEVWENSEPKNSFLRTATRICAAFSRELRSEGIEAQKSQIQLSLFENETSNDVLTRPILDKFADERGHIWVPQGFHRLDGETRARLVAEAVHLTVRTLAGVRNWNVVAIDRAMERVKTDGYRYSWIGPWKHSPDRRSVVRIVGEILDDGYGRVRFEFAVSPEADIDARSPELVVTSRARSFELIERSLRWAGTHHVMVTPKVEMLTRLADVLVDRRDGSVSGSFVTYTPRSNSVDGSAPTDTPKVVPKRQESFRIGAGGGPWEKIPDEYGVELHRSLEIVTTRADWIAWWETTGWSDVWIRYDFGAEAPRSYLRVVGTKASGRIDRPVASIPHGQAGSRAAHDDVLAFVEKAAAKASIRPHPEL